jgi:hypothetical protein
MIHDASTEALLTDFGIAYLPGNKQRMSPYYLSPEQVRGRSPDARSDIYALGVILYEMCTGVLPFHAESQVAVMMQHVNTLPTPPILINPHIPAALSEVILRAMSKEPQTRFASASLLATAVAEACAVEQVPQGSSARNPSSFIELARPQQAQSSSGPLGLPFAQSRPGAEMATMLGVAGPLPPISAKRPAINAHATSTPAIGPVQQTPLTSGPLTVPSTPRVDVALVPSLAVEDRMRFRAANTLSPLGVMIVLLCLLLVVVGSLGITLLRLNAGQGANGPVPDTAAGHVFFQDDALGHDDILRLQMQNLPEPDQGKRYFAWLQEIGGQIVPLGPLSPQNGTATLAYLGDGKHTNLLSKVQGVFVTLENSGQTTPQIPSTKIYQASFSGDSFQYVQHILFYLPGFPVHTSLIAGMFDTIGSMNDKAGSIVDSFQGHDYALVVRQATRILEQIDGSHYAHASGDLPAARPLLLFVPVGLFSSPTQQGYIDALTEQIDKVKQTAGDDTNLLKHAQNVSSALIDLRKWIQSIRGYAMQLLKAPVLGKSSEFSAALRLRQLAQNSYTGITIPPNTAPQPILGSAGAYQAFVDCQYLATLSMNKIA